MHLKGYSCADIAAYALIVEAKDESAVNFYRKFGFIDFENERLGNYFFH